jgi:phospholipid/cholesterol/gamma-HCH transport system substrate-binding protein
METNVSYARVGAFVLGLSFLTIVLGVALSFGWNRQSYQTYLVYMHESVSGLTKKAPVKYNGVDVGYVQSIRLHGNDPRQVVLQLAIERNIPVYVTTEAILEMQGVAGTMAIELKGGEPNSKRLYSTEQTPYPIIRAGHSFLVRMDALLSTASQTLQHTNDVVSALSQWLQKQSRVDIGSDLHKTLQQTQKTLHILQQAVTTIDHQILPTTQHLLKDTHHTVCAFYRKPLSFLIGRRGKPCETPAL